MDWTATARSGWCSMDLHEPVDDEATKGRCPLPSSKCGCPCHVGGEVVRRTPWTPADTVGEDTDEIEETND